MVELEAALDGVGAEDLDALTGPGLLDRTARLTRLVNRARRS